jgi:hypothetical protein
MRLNRAHLIPAEGWPVVGQITYTSPKPRSVVASKIQRQYPLDPKKRKRQKLVGPALKKSIARAGVIQTSANSLSTIANELLEYRKLASQRPIDPVGIKAYNEEMQPVVRAMERQVGWSAQYNDAADVCAKTIANYRKQLRKKNRPYIARRLQKLETLCRGTLGDARNHLIDARNSFAPCFCPSQHLTTDQRFEMAAMLERFSRGRPGTFGPELVARGKPGRKSLAELRRLREENTSTWGSVKWSLPPTPEKKGMRTGKPRKRTH